MGKSLKLVAAWVKSEPLSYDDGLSTDGNVMHIGDLLRGYTDEDGKKVFLVVPKDYENMCFFQTTRIGQIISVFSHREEEIVLPEWKNIVAASVKNSFFAIDGLRKDDDRYRHHYYPYNMVTAFLKSVDLYRERYYADMSEEEFLAMKRVYRYILSEYSPETPNYAYRRVSMEIFKSILMAEEPSSLYSSYTDITLYERVGLLELEEYKNAE